MKNCIKIVFLVLIPIFGMAQQQYPDSLKKVLKTAHADSTRYSALNGIGEYYVEINGDSALYYLSRALPIARKNDRGMNQAITLARLGYVFAYRDKYPESLECFQQALKLAEDSTNEKIIWNPNMPWIQYSTQQKNRLTILAGIHLLYGVLLSRTGDPAGHIRQLKISRAFAKEGGDYNFEGVADMNIGAAYNAANRLDSALLLEQNAERIFANTGYKKYLGAVLGNIGIIYSKKGNSDLAAQYFRRSLYVSIGQKNFSHTNRAYFLLTGYFLAKKQKDSSLYYARKNLDLVQAMNGIQLDQAYEYLYYSYQLAGNTDSAYKYQGLALAARDKHYETTVKSLADFQRLSFKTQLRVQSLEKERAATQTRVRTYVLLGAIGVFMLLSAIFYRNNRQKHKANKILESTLEHLKATQTQLIQAEKMASLGELTAGIAHEIQNPLNFVNNFSEVNTELIGEMKEEIDKGDMEEIKAIAADIEENSKKINLHGRRADAIVKGMLQHSQSGTGSKEPTSINTMAGECMRLAYRALTAKDKSFNAAPIAIGMATHFDETLPKISVIPQDMGRVMLNLFNNAFYAVNQKQKTEGAEYRPEVSVTTSMENGQVVIKIKDNGVGIPDAIKEKIMQPFFTTKPTGEGTGLGLSLSYDIVVKGHGGTISVVTQRCDFTEFIVSLPL